MRARQVGGSRHSSAQNRFRRRAVAREVELMPRRTNISSILVIGAGPIVLGQVCKLEHLGTQAINALKEEGCRIVLAVGACALLLTAACTSQENAASTPMERKVIEERVRACAPDARDARWTRIEALDTWEFGFESSSGKMGEDSMQAKCISRIVEELISPRRLDVMISYSAASESAS
jgi:hypothetical protein